MIKELKRFQVQCDCCEVFVVVDAVSAPNPPGKWMHLYYTLPTEMVGVSCGITALYCPSCVDAGEPTKAQERANANPHGPPTNGFLTKIY